MPRNSHIVRRSVRPACVDRSRQPLRLPARPTTLLVAGILVALVSGDMASACGWYRVRRGCLSPCVVTSCCPRVYCYDPCASSYCGSWSVTYYNSDCCGESSYGVVTTGRDESLQMTPTLAEPHAAKRPATPAPKLEPTEAASPTDLPSVVEQPDALPALDQPPTEPAPPTDLDAPPAAAVPAAPILPGTPATPALPATPTTPATDLAPPVAVEQSSDSAPVEETTPDPGPATTPPAGAAPAATPAEEPEDLFGGAIDPPADAAPTEPPAGSSPAAAPAATPPGETPEEKLDGLFDSPSDQAQPGDAPSDGTTPAPAETEEKGSSDSLENLFNDHRRDRRLPGRPATGGLASDEMRRWTDNTGRYSCRGRLQQISRMEVRILKENGRTSTVPLTRLSQTDLAFVQAEAIAAAERDGVRVAQY